jgi:hypothetical protein
VNLLEVHGPVGLLFAFLIVHALADFPLQGEYLAREKVRGNSGGRPSWFIALSAHSLIHGGGVWWVSGSMTIGLIEVFLHWGIDLGKGEGKFGLVADQLLHVACKLGYVGLLVLLPQPIP